MALLMSPPVRRAARPVLLRERFLSGSFRNEDFEHSLSVTLTAEAIRLEPARWTRRRACLELPLDAIILAHVHRSRLVPRLELFYQGRGGSGSCAFSPHDLRLWVEYLEELGVLLRPRPLDVKALPSRNIGYRARAAMLAAIGAAGALGLAVGVVRLVVGG